jgi:hypothetical protein
VINVAQPRNLATASELEQTFHCGLDDVMGIIRPQGFSEYISHPSGLQDGTNSATGCNSSTPCGWLEQNTTRTIVPQNGVRNGRAGQGNGTQILLGFVDGFPYGFRHLIGFTKTNTNPASPIAYHHKGTEAESPTALYDLCYPIDVHNFVDVFGLLTTCFGHPLSFALRPPMP